jgi:hypothetical protein
MLQDWQRSQATVNLLMFPKPTKSQPISIDNRRELIAVQNSAFETVVWALRTVNPDLHRSLVVKSLTIILDLPALDELSTVSLAEMLFVVIESATHIKSIVDTQNVLLFTAQRLLEVRRL